MTKSSWRDDYQRLVPGRAQAYSRQGPTAPWRLNMPIMNVVGNGGMLTTIGDWMKWNAMLDSRSLGAPLVEALETQGVLNDGRKISYALGLDVGNYKGMKEVSHSGGTAGYQTFLARYPEKKLSVGALCNGFPPSAGDIVDDIVDEALGPFPEAPKMAEGVPMTEEQLKKFVGIWKNERSRNVNRIVLEKGELKLNNNPLKPRADGSFDLDVNVKMKFTVDKDGKPIKAEVLNENGSITNLTANRPGHRPPRSWRTLPATGTATKRGRPSPSRLRATKRSSWCIRSLSSRSSPRIRTSSPAEDTTCGPRGTRPERSTSCTSPSPVCLRHAVYPFADASSVLH